MTNLINGRTTEEIKHTLAWTNFGCGGLECDDCSYRDVCSHESAGRATADALALIEHLEVALKCEQVARTVLMEDMPKWISVEERLPEDRKDGTADCYLVSDGKFIWMAYWACKQWQFAQCTDSPYVIDWTDITHWMPLPEPPKEENV